MKKPAAGIEDNRILTRQQIHFIRLFLNSELKHFFRLTGGTALSAFYFEHRLSEDLDFFSTEKIPLITIETFLKNVNGIEEIALTRHFDRNIFNLKYKDNSYLKVEFTYYPLKNLEETVYVNSLQIDSLLDIVVNKLCAIADRSDAKDYVDVYVALRNSDFSPGELMALAEKKCEIKGIRHILKSRLLQVPKGMESLPLKIEVEPQDVENFLKDIVQGIIEKEISEKAQ